jgi:hypothetical protein
MEVEFHLSDVAPSGPTTDPGGYQRVEDSRGPVQGGRVRLWAVRHVPKPHPRQQKPPPQARAEVITGELRSIRGSFQMDKTE